MVANDLFFSEYVEGSSFNKALEIANFTGGDVSLDDYAVEISFNGGTSVTSIQLSGTLADQDVFVIADDGAEPAILAEADLTPTSSFFNGNDAITLKKNDEIVDVFGQVGANPGASWPGGGANVTLRRKSSVIAGDTNPSDAFNAAAEWDSFPNNTFDGLGRHTIDNGAPTSNISINELRISSSGDSDNDSNFVEIFGAEGTSLDGVSLVALSGEFNPGLVNFAFDLSGLTIDEDGLLLVANPGIVNAISQAVTEANDLLEEFDFFGSPSTFLLVSDFTSNQAADLDADDNGILDSAIGTVIDSISLSDTDGIADQNYSDTVVISDNSFTPAGVARDIDGTGTFQPLDFGSFATDTPGFANEAPPPPVEITKIYTIQGEVHTSALVGQAVTTTGIVTAVDTNGFYLQDAVGDDNIATSDALFVFTGDAPGVNVGDELAVAGMVSEFTPGGSSTGNLSTTQISSVADISILSTGNPLPDAMILGQGGRIPPNQTIDDDAFGAFEPTTDGIDFFESLEAMRVTGQDLVAVAGTNRFGEIFTVANGGADATGISQRGTLNISPDDFNPEKIQIDEDSGVFDFDFPDVNVGDRLGDVTGVVSYSFGNFEILPTEDFTSNIQAAGVQPEVSTIVGDEDTLTVASYNVLNLDPIVEVQANTNNGEARNVDDDLGDGRFDAIAQQIVNNLNTPDIIGLQEVQDNTGGEIVDDIIAADVTLQTLIDAIVAAGGPEYEFIDNTFITDEASGGQPGGNIRTAFLYNPDRVTVDEASIQTIGGQGTGEAFAGARLPLVATFEFNGQDVTVVNNHFSSKGGSAPILGIEQPFDARQEEVNVNGSLDERQRQSQAVQDFVNGLSDDANVVVVGDFYEFEFVSPVVDLETNSGLNNLTNTLPEDERYSFIFQGNSQSLDHILVSDSLLEGAEFDAVHVNAEFAETANRASDHEPLLASFTFSPVEPDLEVGLFDADTDELITLIDNDTEILESDLRNRSVTIAAFVPEESDFFGDVGSVELDLNDGQEVRVENVEPYALFGDRRGDFNGSKDFLAAGENTIEFGLFSGRSLRGDLLGSVSRSFEVVDDIPDTPMPFRVNPYLQQPSSDGIYITWFTETDSSGDVSISGPGLDTPLTFSTEPTFESLLSYTDAELNQEIDGLEQGSWLLGNENYKHTVDVDELQPGSTYTYTVTVDGQVFESNFTTAPTADDWEHIRFVAFSDSETEPRGRVNQRDWQQGALETDSLDRPAVEGSLWAENLGVSGNRLNYPLTETVGYLNNLKIINSRNPDFLVMPGDLIQGGGYQPAWDEFFRHNAGEFDSGLSEYAILHALGNWENFGALNGGYGIDDDGRYGPLFGRQKVDVYFDAPENGTPEHQDNYYRIDYGPVTILTLDCSIGELDDSRNNYGGDGQPLQISGQEFTGPGTDTQANITREQYEAEGGTDLSDFNPGSPQWNWVIEQLEDARANGQMIFAQFHHIPYSSGTHGLPMNHEDSSGQGGTPMRQYHSLFEEYGVVAVFSGHSEMFERSFVDEDGDGVGVQYYDVGVAGDGMRGRRTAANGDLLGCCDFSRWTADQDEPELWEDVDGVLQNVAGGKHYGHLEVNVQRLDEEGGAEVTFTPVYSFPILDSNYELVETERRIYGDEITLEINADGVVNPLDGFALEVGLYNTITDELIAPIQNGSTISVGDLADGNLTVAAFAVGDVEVGSVELDLNNGEVVKREKVEPYALFGDRGGDFSGGSLALGQNTIEFEAYSKHSLGGESLGTTTIDFTLM